MRLNVNLWYVPFLQVTLIIATFQACLLVAVVDLYVLYIVDICSDVYQNVDTYIHQHEHNVFLPNNPHRLNLIHSQQLPLANQFP